MLNLVDEEWGSFICKFGVIHVRQGKGGVHSLFQNYLVSRALFYFITAVSQSDVGTGRNLM